jgi:hypothetical protein
MPHLPTVEALDAAYIELEKAGLIEAVNDYKRYETADGSYRELRAMYKVKQ